MARRIRSDDRLESLGSRPARSRWGMPSPLNCVSSMQTGAFSRPLGAEARAREGSPRSPGCMRFRGTRSSWSHTNAGAFSTKPARTSGAAGLRRKGSSFRTSLRCLRTEPSSRITGGGGTCSTRMGWWWVPSRSHAPWAPDSRGSGLRFRMDPILPQERDALGVETFVLVPLVRQ
jgi:hypothetical protein